ncbi:hypothetical protein C8P66_10558 [Humitalea rosea]|uniref:Peptidoglycan binding protein n=1 Tax=Humitalea rosea TaxID=990373 RepID=A0A2W7IQR6_9PROT|nr:hypothetical protein [Humitalea rosea]PZW48311.1 hypothetical protein C8P66_10558 [Humitalea rosea]
MSKPLLVRAMTLRGCQICEMPDAEGASVISASVGLGGRNKADDVRTIQHLLNGVAASAGGPLQRLAEDGLIGPRTINAISRFQKARLGWSDGRVDPGKQTLQHLQASQPNVGGQTAPGGTPGAAGTGRTPQETLRIGRATAQIPRVKSALQRAMLRLQEAEDFCTREAGGMPSLQTAGEGAWLVFAKHFGLAPAQRRQGLAPLAGVRNILRSMITIYARGTSITGGVVFGAAIYDARPHHPQHADWIAFAFFGGFHNGGRIDHGLREDSIYFCEGMDGGTDGLFFHTSLHELAHFVGDRPEARPIVDHAYTTDPAYERLTSAQRLTNAESYANYIADFTLGTIALDDLRGPSTILLQDPIVEANGGITRGKASAFPPGKRPG